MHRCNVANAAILHHYDDDVDLLHHCHVLVYLFSLPGILTYSKKHLFQETTFTGCAPI